MKLNRVEKLVINNPLRVVQQKFEIRRFRKMFRLEPGAQILEVGCGRGAGAGLILKNFHPARLYALDLDFCMIQKAKKFRFARQEHLSLYVGDGTQLPFRKASMDAVFGFGFLHHVPDWQAGLAEVARVLKTGGVYFMEEIYPALYQNPITRHVLLHPRDNRFDSRDLKSALDANKLLLKETVECKQLGILGVAVKTNNHQKT
ncbi:MAG: class I SAM-dependent methyltransferase [Desulfobacterales bacterium]|nr:class I SAM-dependent methyltransferase [Desulfobacterales bacterium]